MEDIVDSMRALGVDSGGVDHFHDPEYLSFVNCSAWCHTDSPYCNCTFSNTTSDSDDEELYDVPVEVIVLLSIFYITISAVAVVGNSLVIWIVAASRGMQNVTNYYIANLALADIVIGLFAIPFQFQAALLQRWILPHFMCPFCPFVQVLTVTVSVFTLTAIAIDRHRAILNPLSARPSKLRAKISIGVIWVASGMLATPIAAANRVTLVSHGDGARVKPFCQNVYMSKEAMMTYRWVLWVLQYLMPLCIITLCTRAWRCGCGAPRRPAPPRTRGTPTS